MKSAKSRVVQEAAPFLNNMHVIDYDDEGIDNIKN